ncbi:flavocytochrome c [Fusobacterium sp. PH5-44]|uniref:flavocytochrome c n=1 Tax=unclassified Fusobacterium TaxID=2648384 RepID=UPI003D221553
MKKNAMKIFNFLSLVLLTVFISLSSTLKDGNYTSTTKGNNGNIKLEAIVKDGKISDIAIKEHSETKGIFEVPMERIPKLIIENQSVAIDTIAGATVTSKAILEGAKDIIVQAGGKVEDYMSKVKTQVTQEELTKTADVIIVGGGGAGLSAAVAAAEEGASVIVIEKMAALGGNTVLAGGGYNAFDSSRQSKQTMNSAQLETVKKILSIEPKNDLHKELLTALQKQFDEYNKNKSTHIFDSVEFHTLQSYDGGDYLGNLELIHITMQRSAEMVGILETYGLEWKEGVTTYVGGLWPRAHEASKYKSGIGFVDTFTDVIKNKKLNIEIIFETKAEELITTGDRITGVKATGNNGTKYTFNANKGVILATGGFGANTAMVRKYKPSVSEKVKTTNAPSITGDGIEMAEKVGADLIDMDQIQLLPTSNPVTGGSPGYVGQNAGMYINKEGKRFVNEYSRRDVLTEAVFKQTDGIFYIVTNEKNALLDADRKNKFGEKIDDLIATKQVFKGDTVEELAKAIGVEPAVLVETFNKWREACKTGIDKEFGRNAFAENVWLEEGPYYVAPRSPAVHHTMGGVKIDKDLHVLNKDGNIIKGLYAVGEITGGIHGSNRLGGNAVPDALANGRRAGKIAITGN